MVLEQSKNIKNITLNVDKDLIFLELDSVKHPHSLSGFKK